MISGQTLRVCPEGKPASTFPDRAPIQLASGSAAILEDIAAVALSHARLHHIGLSSMPKTQSCIGQGGSTIAARRRTISCSRPPLSTAGT
jgi:hypothetical protein